MSTDYDVITIGGGLGGSALAKVLAEHGIRVLVVERESHFTDRIRGEWITPWGAAEAQRIGIYDALLERCAHEAPFFEIVGRGPVRDLKATTPQALPALTFYHPAMQEALIQAAHGAGAEIWRGVAAREITSGNPLAVMVEREGSLQRVTARLVVCADGRSSTGRKWGGFQTRRAKQKLFGAGQLFKNLATAEGTFILLVNPQLRRYAILLPIGGGLVRGYLMYDLSKLDRLQGTSQVSRFVDECVKTGLPRDCYTDADPIGPLASFDLTETWVEHPYREGVVLIGDAAGSSDPSWGQGLSITIRDVRELSESLLAGNDWDVASDRYAQARDIYFQTDLRVHEWAFDLFFGEGLEADRLRERVFPLHAAEPERVPDHAFSGLDLPADEEVKRRYFGEV